MNTFTNAAGHWMVKLDTPAALNETVEITRNDGTTSLVRITSDYSALRQAYEFENEERFTTPGTMLGTTHDDINALEIGALVRFNHQLKTDTLGLSTVGRLVAKTGSYGTIAEIMPATATELAEFEAAELAAQIAESPAKAFSIAELKVVGAHLGGTFLTAKKALNKGAMTIDEARAIIGAAAA